MTAKASHCSQLDAMLEEGGLGGGHDTGIGQVQAEGLWNGLKSVDGVVHFPRISGISEQELVTVKHAVKAFIYQYCTLLIGL